MRSEHKPSFVSMTARMLAAAADEAVAFNHPFIGAEHLLLAILRARETPASTVLHDAGVTGEAFRREIMDAVGPGSTRVEGHIAVTPRVKRILQVAAGESGRFGSGAGDSRLILFALLIDGGGLATRILSHMGVDQRRMALDLAEGLCSESPEVPGPAVGEESSGSPLFSAPPALDPYHPPGFIPLSPWGTLPARKDG